MILNDTWYKILKWLALIFLPALGTLYFALSKLWNLPYATEIVGTLSAVAVFIGSIIGISTANYNKENVEQPPDEQVNE